MSGNIFENIRKMTTERGSKSELRSMSRNSHMRKHERKVESGWTSGHDGSSLQKKGGSRNLKSKRNDESPSNNGTRGHDKSGTNKRNVRLTLKVSGTRSDTSNEGDESDDAKFANSKIDVIANDKRRARNNLVKVNGQRDGSNSRNDNAPSEFTPSGSRSTADKSKHQKGTYRSGSAGGEITENTNRANGPVSESEYESSTCPRTPRTDDLSQDSAGDFDMDMLDNMDLSTIANYSDDESTDIPGIRTKSASIKKAHSKRRRAKMNKKSDAKAKNSTPSDELNMKKNVTSTNKKRKLKSHGGKRSKKRSKMSDKDESKDENSVEDKTKREGERKTNPPVLTIDKYIQTSSTVAACGLTSTIRGVRSKILGSKNVEYSMTDTESDSNKGIKFDGLRCVRCNEGFNSVDECYPCNSCKQRKKKIAASKESGSDNIPMSHVWHQKCIYRGIREASKTTWRSGKCPEDMCIICSGAPRYTVKKGSVESKMLLICSECKHSEHLSCSLAYKEKIDEAVYNENRSDSVILYEEKDKNGNPKRIYLKGGKCLKCLLGLVKFEKVTGLCDLYG